MIEFNQTNVEIGEKKKRRKEEAFSFQKDRSSSVTPAQKVQITNKVKNFETN